MFSGWRSQLEAGVALREPRGLPGSRLKRDTQRIQTEGSQKKSGKCHNSAVQVPPECCTVCGTMVKANSVRVNMRLRDEARFALDELASQWGCSQTAAFERAVMEAHRRVSGGSGGEAEPRVAAGAAGRGVDPKGVVGGGGYDAICGHCGAEFQIASGRPPSTICGECHRAGHKNVPNCMMCRKREHYALKASKDSISDNSHVDYEAFDD